MEGSDRKKEISLSDAEGKTNEMAAAGENGLT